MSHKNTTIKVAGIKNILSSKFLFHKKTKKERSKNRDIQLTDTSVCNCILKSLNYTGGETKNQAYCKKLPFTAVMQAVSSENFTKLTRSNCDGVLLKETCRSRHATLLEKELQHMRFVANLVEFFGTFFAIVRVLLYCLSNLWWWCKRVTNY